MGKDRVSSGISGLDRLLDGGYIRGRSMLIVGGPGTGKSILTWHFLFDGLVNNERAVLLSLDQPPDIILGDMANFGWDPSISVENKSLSILSGTLNLVPNEMGFEYMISFDHPLLREQPFTIPRLAELVKKRATEIDASRIVVDGIGPLLELAGNRFEIRQMVYSFLRELARDKRTLLLTHELRSSPGAGNDEMPYFIADGVIKLDMLYSSGDYVRTMRVIKIRGTSHIMRPIMFKISENGIEAYPDARLPE
jgi:KaiC/GvpD/RAD55 family RecA-like ATPase